MTHMQERFYSSPCLVKLKDNPALASLREELNIFFEKFDYEGCTMDEKYNSISDRLEPVKRAVLKDIIEFLKRESDNYSLMKSDNVDWDPSCHFIHHKRARRGSLKREGEKQDQGQREIEQAEKRKLDATRAYLFALKAWNAKSDYFLPPELGSVDGSSEGSWTPF